MRPPGPIEAKLVPGEEKLPWYTAEELFAKGLTRGQLDRLMMTRNIRWARGWTLRDFAASLGMVVQVNLDALYFQAEDRHFIDQSPEGVAARTALDALGVQHGTRCVVCGNAFPDHLLLPDKFRRMHCAACTNEHR